MSLELDQMPGQTNGLAVKVGQGRRNISRRQFLKLTGTVGIGAALFGTGLERVLAADDLDNMGDLSEHQWAMVFDLRLCDGCRDCIKGCQEMHYLPETYEWIKVYELEDAAGQNYFMPVLCQMCQQAPCVRVCPVKATYHTPDGGIVIDQDVCIGCRMCMAACPYQVRVFNWDDHPEVPEEARVSTPELQIPQQKGTVGKCDNCLHELREGRYPACLEWCSMGAIYVGDLMTDVASNSYETVQLSKLLREGHAWRFKDELGTETRVYYISGWGEDLDY